MKRIILLACLLTVVWGGQGQLLKKITDHAKDKAEKTINKSAGNTAGKTEDPTVNPDQKKDTDSIAVTGKPEEPINTTTGNQPAGFKAYSKYDFVPGEKMLGFEDFTTGSIGDFPAGWNTNGAGEIVTLEGKPGRWLWITKPGVFMPEFTNAYPEDFTFEFDLLHGVPFRGGSLELVIAEMYDVSKLQGWNTSPNIFKTSFYVTDSRQKQGSISTEIRKSSITESSNQVYSELMSDKYNPAHVSVWRQKERLRIYVNQEKIWDVPKAIAAHAKLNAIFFSSLAPDPSIPFYIGNLRLAVGAPDTRKKMLEQNKWVTHGILFDVNSANIKPESYGTLKEMANVLKEYPDLKVKIIGHTDADGNDASNLDLSKRRAASVKLALAHEFGIDESRMETDGKGETEPINKNDSPVGKAGNRRVEFVKI